MHLKDRSYAISDYACRSYMTIYRRIAIANICQEINTFAARPTTLADLAAFGLLAGPAIVEWFR